MKLIIRPACAHDLPRVNALKAGVYGACGYGSQTAEVQLGNNDVVLVAEAESAEVVGTISGQYYKDGVPAHQVFRDEILHYHAQSRLLAHCGSFAVCRSIRPAGLRSIGLTLISEMVALASANYVDTVTIIVNPVHVDFYVGLGFEQVAKRTEMPGLTNAPAVLLAATGESLQNLYRRKAIGARLYYPRRSLQNISCNPRVLCNEMA